MYVNKIYWHILLTIQKEYVYRKQLEINTNILVN